MSHALRVLEKTAEHAPALKRAVAFNGLHGEFEFPNKSPAAKLLSDLSGQAGLSASLKIPLVAGQSMQALAALRHDHRGIMDSEVAKLAAEIDESEWIVDTCLSHFAHWYEASLEEGAKILPFPA